MRQQPVIHSQILAREIFEEGLEEMLEVGIGALNQHAALVLVVDVLIHEVNSLPVHRLYCYCGEREGYVYFHFCTERNDI
jgi:hypothetical protein